MMAQYASETSVSQEKSRNEIEATLKRYGATSFMYATGETGAMVQFIISGRQVRFLLAMPDPKAREFTHSSRGARPSDVAYKAWEQAGRQRWRALALVIKAKLEAVASGITTVEDEFLAQTLLPDGSTVAQFIQPQVAIAYERGSMPTTLLLASPTTTEPAK